MKIETHINRYSPENYLTVTITFARNEAVSFSEVASEVQRAVVDANDQVRDMLPTDRHPRQVLPKGYFGDE